MFIVISFSGDAQRPFGRFEKALKESPCFDCAAEAGSGVSEVLLHFG
jgi:hypothetical protein